jgi:hypothetical protein
MQNFRLLKWSLCRLESEESKESPYYLSIVAVSRNDDHGDKLLYRMQAFVDGVIEQSLRHEVLVELILVEWNPPDHRPSLAEALKIPKEKKYCDVRIIQVLKEVHQKVDPSDKFPLFQMIGKNVGIRRARGEYVLATNIDILFSDEIFSYFKQKKLKPGEVYRVDRLDIPSQLPEKVPYETVLNFCKTHFFRINARYRTKILINKRFPVQQTRIFFHNLLSQTDHFLAQIKNQVIRILDNKSQLRKLKTYKKILRLLKTASILALRQTLTFTIEVLFKCYSLIKSAFRLAIRGPQALIFFRSFPLGVQLRPHSNGCGDFTLLSRKGWEFLRGYPEWPIFSWHIDSIFLYQAVISGFKERNLGQESPIYHIEHGVGSGYTPEGFQALIKRLDDKGIYYLDMQDFRSLVKRMVKAWKKSPTLLYNGKQWGLIDETFHEISL